ncbi:hypothetical protein AURDEDRAFT_137474 [Auricularia subglabra TFB-10046 SS5]|nr:hypothetical protein AURDEDRAFT_137474 [Auricularia subglabra TFB-10046 SS5]
MHLPTTALPPPTHVLRLSSASFLDGVITLDGAPAYAFNTTDSTTTIARCSPLGLQRRPAHQDAFVQLGGARQPEAAFLRRSAFSSSRKFRVAQGSFKWRHVPARGTFECPGVLAACARIRLYSPFSTDAPLVDALVLSAMLVTARPDEWRAICSPFHHHHRSEPRMPDALPAYQLDLLAGDDSVLPSRRETKLQREQHHSVRRVRSLAPHAFSSSSSSSSASSLWSRPSTSSSMPSSPASARRPLPSLLSVDTSVLSISATPSPVSSYGEPADSHWIHAPEPRTTESPKALHPPPFGDEPDASPYNAKEAPPPYEQHQWTVRVPVRAYAKY